MRKIKMFELHQVGEKSYYIDCPAKIGLYRINDAEVYLIDSGNDKDAGRKIRRILNENGWSLKGIINLTQTILAAINIYSSKQAVKSLRTVLKPHLQSTLCWSRRFCTAATPVKI